MLSVEEQKISINELIIFHTLNNGHFQDDIAFEKGISGVLMLLLMIKKKTKGRNILFNTIITGYVESAIQILERQDVSLLHLSEFCWTIHHLRKDPYFSSGLSGLNKDLLSLVIDKIRLSENVDTALPRTLFLLSEASPQGHLQVILKLLKRHVSFYLGSTRLLENINYNDLQLLYCLGKHKMVTSADRKVGRIFTSLTDLYNDAYFNCKLRSEPIECLYLSLYIARLYILHGDKKSLVHVSKIILECLPEWSARYNGISPEGIEFFDLLKRLTLIIPLKWNRMHLINNDSTDLNGLADLSLSNIRGMGALYKSISNSNLTIYPI